MLTGMLLDNNIFTNVEVSNGKLINDGDRTAIIGFAFPGLQNNLNIDKEDFEIPDYIEISADVKNFEFGITITIAANELFNNFDADKLDSAENILDAFDELNSAMNKLMNGSSELYDGLSALLDKSGELSKELINLRTEPKHLKRVPKIWTTGQQNFNLVLPSFTLDFLNCPQTIQRLHQAQNRYLKHFSQPQLLRFQIRDFPFRS